MAILLDTFPDDEVLRQLVAIDGIEFSAIRSNERRWKVVLRSDKDRSKSVHTVSSDYLLLLSLGSRWKKGRSTGFNPSLPGEELFELDDAFPVFLWRAESVNNLPKFMTHSVAGRNATSLYPAYQFINAYHPDGGYETLCVSTSEIIRFYVSRAPALSRHLFEFREGLQNPRLYRFLGDNFLKGIPEKIEIADKNLGSHGRKLLISMLSNQVGKKQILSVSRTARSANYRNRNSNGKLGKVFPVFGLPHEANCSLSVIGKRRNVIVQDQDEEKVIPVFAVTRITKTGHNPPEQDMTILSLGGSMNSRSLSRPARLNRPLEDISHDALEPSNTDSEILVDMGIDVEGDYPGLKNIEIKDEVVHTPDQQSPFFENEDGSLQLLSKLSTERGTHIGGSTGYGRGHDSNEPAAIHKSLLLVDEDLPDLITCEPEIALLPEDIKIVDYEVMPARLKLVAACILRTSSSLGTDWSTSFFGKKTYGNRVPLLNLKRFQNEQKLPKTGGYRRAIVGEIRGDSHRIFLFDIENRKSEAIGIFSIIFPKNTRITWKTISYILQHRLDQKTWPNAETHGGGYAAKVHPHKSFFDNDETLRRTTRIYIRKLQDAIQHL